MNRIFFVNKGHTRKINIPNIWPYKSVHSTPLDFFSEPGLTLRMDPKAMNHGKYFKCEFNVIINSSARVVEYVPGRQYVNCEVAAHGTYNNWKNGFINIQLSKDMSNIPHEHIVRHAILQKAAVDLVYEGVQEFKSYFMREE
jgi:hypothetical protein